VKRWPEAAWLSGPPGHRLRPADVRHQRRKKIAVAAETEPQPCVPLTDGARPRHTRLVPFDPTRHSTDDGFAAHLRNM
jgi:hypothetical protein